jgi:hypothetical protein
MAGFPYNRPYIPLLVRAGAGGVCAHTVGSGGHCRGHRQSLFYAPLAPCTGGGRDCDGTGALCPRLVPLGIVALPKEGWDDDAPGLRGCHQWVWPH